MAVPVILILGRPNVGKSSLFNRLTKTKRSIVADEPGVTRDLIYETSKWKDHHFILIDSGGVFFEDTGEETNVFQPMVESIVKQAAIEADYLIFLTDVKSGITPYDRFIANFLRPFEYKTSIVANKCESELEQQQYNDFYELGYSGVYPVSAKSGYNINGLLESIFSALPEDRQGRNKPVAQAAIHVSILGRPNVGKSSLVNALFGEEIALVSDIPGTTRDSTDHLVKADGQWYKFIDTAGLRKKSRMGDAIEFFSYIRTIRSLEESQVSLLILDATLSVSDQDKHIGAMIAEKGNGVIILVNKWDLIEKNNSTMNQYIDYVRKQLPFLDFAPLLFVSAVSKQRLNTIYEEILNVDKAYHLTLSKTELNNLVKKTIKLPSKCKIYYINQTPAKQPKFTVYVNKADLFKGPLIRQITRQMRSVYPYIGCPIQLTVRES